MPDQIVSRGRSTVTVNASAEADAALAEDIYGLSERAPLYRSIIAD